jgi:hypothetical protein
MNLEISNIVMWCVFLNSWGCKETDQYCFVGYPSCGTLPTIILAIWIHAACVAGCRVRINSLAMCCPTAHHNYTHTHRHSISSLPASPPHIICCSNLLTLTPLAGEGGIHPHRIIIEWNVPFLQCLCLLISIINMEVGLILNLCWHLSPITVCFLGG